jgi:hypothetical protein
LARAPDEQRRWFVMKTRSVVLLCFLLAGVAGCGSSASSSSTTQPATASGTVQNATTHAASAARTRAAQSSGSHTGSTQTATTHAASATTTAAAQSSGSPSSTAGSSAGGVASASTRSYGSVAAFGRQASGSERSAVLAALHGYMSAIAAGDWAAACGQLSTVVKHELQLLLAHAKRAGGLGCAAALGALVGQTPGSLRRQQTQLTVIAVRTEGDRAFVLYHSTQQPHGVIPMIREQGGWKAEVLGGSNVG